MSKRAGTFQIKAEGKKASLRLIGSIGWWKNSGEEFTSQIDQLLKDGVSEVEIYINSGGGSVFDANEIYNQLKRLKGVKNGRIGALCASAATIVSLACDNLVMSRNGMYMVHEPRISTQDSTINDLENSANLLKQLRSNFIKLYSKKSGLNEEEVASMLAKETWLNAESAKLKGFVDQIGDPDEDAEATALAVQSLEAESLPVVMSWMSDLSSNQSSISNSDYSMKKIAMHFNMPDNSSEDQILASIKELQNKYDSLVAANLQRNKDSAIRRVDAAIAAKQITADKRDLLIEKGTNDPSVLDLILENVRPAASASASIVHGNTNQSAEADADRQKWTFADWAKNDPGALEKMRETKPAEYEKLGKAYYGEQFSITE